MESKPWELDTEGHSQGTYPHPHTHPHPKLYHDGWLLEFYVLTPSKVISGRVPTCDSAHSWRLHSVALLANQATGIMTRFPTQSHFPDTELTSPCLKQCIHMCIHVHSHSDSLTRLVAEKRERERGCECERKHASGYP